MRKQSIICNCECGCRDEHRYTTKRCGMCHKSRYINGVCQGRKQKPEGMPVLDWWMQEDKWTLDIETGCWLSHTYLNEKGYPVVSDSYSGRPLGNLVLEKKLGRKLKPGFAEVMRHICHVRQCINPDHLIPGTPKDNARDRDEAGRQYDRHGEKNGRSKLNETQVRFIRKYNKAQGDCPMYSYPELAKMFDVSSVQIDAIANYRSWKEIARYA